MKNTARRGLALALVEGFDVVDENLHAGLSPGVGSATSFLGECIEEHDLVGQLGPDLRQVRRAAALHLQHDAVLVWLELGEQVVGRGERERLRRGEDADFDFDLFEFADGDLRETTIVDGGATGIVHDSFVERFLGNDVADAASELALFG